MAERMLTIECIMTDLTPDGNGGWSTNVNWQKTEIIEVPESLSDLAKARRIKAALGIQGMRRDGWGDEGWSWRDGWVGAYATITS